MGCFLEEIRKAIFGWAYKPDGKTYKIKDLKDIEFNEENNIKRMKISVDTRSSLSYI